MITETAKKILAQASSPEQAAEVVLEACWDKKLPVDPVRIANRLGVKIFLDPSLQISGHYTQEPTGDVIYINPSEPVSRQRFTAFHELGHFVLAHGPRPRDPFQMYNQYYFDTEESAANRFAAAMIMPKEAVEFCVNVKGYNLSQIADTFAVSQTAARIRLGRLGLVTDYASAV